MICIRRPETDPYFNIAAEEFFLKNRQEDIVMIWQCDPVVFIGKHQNAMAEVNPEVIRDQQIPVIRRVSGGGTVYHDHGNINYTLIKTETNRERLVNFRNFTKPIINFLEELGIQANFEGKNNLVIGAKKFSGNSAHVYRNRVIHHGTILFDSDLNNLNYCIKPSGLTIEDNAVKSIRATVTNIREHLQSDISFDEFKASLEKYMLKFFNISNIEEIAIVEQKAIKSLVKNKYATNAWNFGYSPKYTVSSSVKIENEVANLQLKVVDGMIVKTSIKGHTKKIIEMRKILEKVLGLRHHPVDIDTYLSEIIENEKDRKLFKEILF